MKLPDLKNYLRIDDDADDGLLKEMMLESEAYIDACVGVAYKKDLKGKRLAAIVQKRLIADMYERRSTYASSRTNIDEKKKRDVMVTTIFQQLALME